MTDERGMADEITAAHEPLHGEMTMNHTSDMKTNEKSFRPADADKRTASAGAAVARTRAAFDKAQSDVNATEQACVEDPSEKALAAARTARRALDDATRDHELAQQHAAKVSAQIDAAERTAIAAEIDRLEAERGKFGVVDDALYEAAVEIGVIASQIDAELAARHATRIAAQPAIDALLGRIGKPISNYESDTRRITQELVGLVLAARGGVGSEFLWSVASKGNSLAATRASGAPESATAEEERVSAYVARVRSRRAGSGAGLAVKAAALIGVGALALALAQG